MSTSDSYSPSYFISSETNVYSMNFSVSGILMIPIGTCQGVVLWNSWRKYVEVYVKVLDTLYCVLLLPGMDVVLYGNWFLHSEFKIIGFLLFWQCIYSTSLVKVIKCFGHNIRIVLNFSVTLSPWICCFRYFLFGALGFGLFMRLCQDISF